MDITQREYWELPTKEMKPGEVEMDRKRRASVILADTVAIENRQYSWYLWNLWNATVYTNRSLVGFRWGGGSKEDDQAEFAPANLNTENLIENIGSTYLSKAASSPLRPTIVPHGTSWKTARDIKVADKFVFAMWRATNAETICREMFNDAYTAGVGCIQVDFDKKRKRLVAESVFFDNIVIDNRECANRALPRTYRIRKAVPHAALCAKYRRKLEKHTDRYNPKRKQGDDFEIVVEIWRMPDDEGVGGYHAVVACGEILFEETWEDSQPPLVFLHFSERISGFFVRGGVEQVVPYQIIQNDLNAHIQATQKVGCRPLILAPASTQFDWSQFDNGDPGAVILYHGMEPKPWTISNNLTEMYAERERNKAAVYSQMGLNEMFATGDVPEQVRYDSSAGIREARNMEDARHLRLWSAYELARLELAKTFMRVLGRFKDSGAGEYSAMYRPYGFSTAGAKIAYKAIAHLTEEQFSWEMQAASLAHMSPAARRETVAAWAARGQTTVMGGQTAQMVSNPDLELIERMELASEEDIERHIMIMENGGYEPPSVLTNISKGIMMVTANLHKLRTYEDLELTSPIIKNHERWIIKATARQAALVQQEQMQQQQMTPYQPTQGMLGTSAGMA